MLAISSSGNCVAAIHDQAICKDRKPLVWWWAAEEP